MATHYLGHIVPYELEDYFTSSNSDLILEITDVMHDKISGFREWDYFKFVNEGLMIEADRKPSNKELNSLFETLLVRFSVVEETA